MRDRPESVSPDAKTAVALVGCGAWGRNILRDLILLGHSVHVVDPDAAARSSALERGASHVYERLDDLPACSGYVVAAPIPDLTPVCARLLEHKKPVFSEKTLCMSMRDYEFLAGLEGSENVFVMHKWHYHPGIEALRAVVESGEIGELEEMSTTRHAWVNDWHGGDVFWTQAVHDLTIVKHILGHIPTEIRAINVIKDRDGLPVSVTAMLGSKPAVNISVSGRHTSKKSGVSLHGQRGSAELCNAHDDHIKVRNEKGEAKVAIDTTFPLYLELKEFTEYLAGGRKPRCNLEDAKEVTQAILNLKKEA